MPSILFVCLANRFRSPLSEAIYRQCLEEAGEPGNWLISSAGTWTENGLPADFRAIQDAHEIGLDIKGHRSRQVDAKILSENDLILVMEAGQKEALRIEFPAESGKIYLLSEAANGLPYDIPDPFGPAGEPHREVASELHTLIRRGFSKIHSLALKLEN
jgi:protein-tyrosine phosphatase